MTIDYDKIQSSVKGLGIIAENTSFLEGFLSAFNFPKSTFARLSLTAERGVYEGVSIQNKIFFLSTTATNLYSEFNVLKKNNLARIRADFIIIANETELIAYERDSEETLETSKENLYRHIEFFFSLTGLPSTVRDEIKSADMKTAEKFAQLHYELLRKNQGREDDIEELICRILFCCFADSMGVLANGNISTLVSNYTETSGSNLDVFMNSLFEAIKSEGRENLSGYFADVKFIDRRLFNLRIPTISYTRVARNLIIQLLELNWLDISPEILGCLIQSIIRPADSSYSGNYTSTANVQKVVGPLFINELHRLFERDKGNTVACRALLERICQISVFDPSCGAGNFLLVTYRELSKLAKRIAETLGIEGSSPSVSSSNFYGIDGSYFSCAITRLGFLFVVCQEKQGSGNMDEVFAGALDILFAENIVNANATRKPWDSVCPGNSETYIIGNPSYCGGNRRTDAQKSDIAYVYSDYQGYANLDYASCWFMLATKYITSHGGAFAFVTTNSLTQGEQVQLLWQKIFDKGVHIRFAYTSFRWKNNARNRTTVTVVILGIASGINRQRCELYTPTTMFEPKYITPYLTSVGNIVKKEHSPISNLPRMIKGNMPLYWSSHLLSREAKDALIARIPRTKKFLMKVVGGDELIDGFEKWCFWIRDNDLEEAMSIEPIAEKIALVRQARQSSRDASARRLANRAHQFRTIHETTTQSLVVPEVSSEHREYFQIDFRYKDTIIDSTNYVIFDCEHWVFGVIASKMHNVWIRTVCGALETRIRYSPRLGYNTFPFPDITEEQKIQFAIASLGLHMRVNNTLPERLRNYIDPTICPKNYCGRIDC